MDLNYGRWFDNDVEQVNVDLRTGRSFGVRVFHIHVKKKPTEKHMRKIGHFICDAVTETRDNIIPLLYDEDIFRLKQSLPGLMLLGKKS